MSRGFHRRPRDTFEGSTRGLPRGSRQAYLLSDASRNGSRSPLPRGLQIGDVVICDMEAVTGEIFPPNNQGNKSSQFPVIVAAIYRDSSRRITGIDMFRPGPNYILRHHSDCTVVLNTLEGQRTMHVNTHRMYGVANTERYFPHGEESVVGSISQEDLEKILKARLFALFRRAAALEYVCAFDRLEFGSDTEREGVTFPLRFVKDRNTLPPDIYSTGAFTRRMPDMVSRGDVSALMQSVRVPQAGAAPLPEPGHTHSPR